jgi:hypothetical protein
MNFVTSWWVIFHGLRFSCVCSSTISTGSFGVSQVDSLMRIRFPSACSTVYHFVVLPHSWRQFHVHFLLMTQSEPVHSSACDILEFGKRHCWTISVSYVLRYTRSSMAAHALPYGEENRSHSNCGKLLIHYACKLLLCLNWRVMITCSTSGVPRFFFGQGAGYTRIFFRGGGVQNIQWRTEGRETGDLGAIAP